MGSPTPLFTRFFSCSAAFSCRIRLCLRNQVRSTRMPSRESRSAKHMLSPVYCETTSIVNGIIQASSSETSPVHRACVSQRARFRIVIGGLAKGFRGYFLIHRKRQRRIGLRTICSCTHFCVLGPSAGARGFAPRSRDIFRVMRR